MLSKGDNAATVNEAFQKNYAIWIPFLIQCMRVKEGPSKAPSFYLFQEVRWVSASLLRETKDEKLALDILNLGLGELHKQINAFLASKTLEDDHVTAAFVFCMAAVQVLPPAVVARLAGDFSFEKNEAALNKLLEFLVSDAFRKVKEKERAGADPHNAHYPVAQIFGMAAAFQASLYSSQLNLKDSANAQTLLAFVKKNLADIVAHKDHEDRAQVGFTAISVIANALEQQDLKELYKSVANLALETSVDKDIPTLTAIYSDRKYVSIDQFDAFVSKIVPKAINAVLSCRTDDLNEISQHGQQLIGMIGSLETSSLVAIKALDTNLEKLVEKITGLFPQFAEGAGEAGLFISLLGVLGDAFGARAAKLIAKSPSFEAVLNGLESLLANQYEGAPLAGVLAVHCRSELLGHAAVWRKVFDAIIGVLNSTVQMFPSCVGLGHPDEDGDASVGSWANGYWAAHKLCVGFPEMVKESFDAFLSSVNGLRGCSSIVRDNMALTWIGLLAVNKDATLAALKNPVNSFFFANAAAQMASDIERQQILDGLRAVHATNPDVVEFWIKYSASPNANPDEAESVAKAAAAKADWKKKAEEALAADNYDFGFTDDTKEPANLSELKNLSLEQKAKWVEAVKKALGDALASKIL